MSDYHLFSQKTVKARKSHTCIWCGQGIHPGDTYEREQSIFDGNWQNHAWHPECLADRLADLKDGGDSEFTAYSAPRPEKLDEVVYL